MNSAAVNDELRRIGERYTGAGVIVECGTWLGAGIKHISDGIGDKPAEFHCFDNFTQNASEAAKAALAGVDLPEGADTRDWIRSHVLPQMPRSHGVRFHKGDVRRVKWYGGKIEVFILDSVKTQSGVSAVLLAFVRHLMRGCMVGFLDANFQPHPDKYASERGGERRWIVKHMQRITDYHDIGVAAFFTFK